MKLNRRNAITFGTTFALAQVSSIALVGVGHANPLRLFSVATILRLGEDLASFAIQWGGARVLEEVLRRSEYRGIVQVNSSAIEELAKTYRSRSVQGSSRELAAGLLGILESVSRYNDSKDLRVLNHAINRCDDMIGLVRTFQAASLPSYFAIRAIQILCLQEAWKVRNRGNVLSFVVGPNDEEKRAIEGAIRRSENFIQEWRNDVAVSLRERVTRDPFCVHPPCSALVDGGFRGPFVNGGTFKSFDFDQAVESVWREEYAPLQIHAEKLVLEWRRLYQNLEISIFGPRGILGASNVLAPEVVR